MEEEKKPDGRRNNGAVKGVSRGQGRPRKTKNKDIDKMTLNALKKAFGSEEKAWIEIAKLAKGGSTPNHGAVLCVHLRFSRRENRHLTARCVAPCWTTNRPRLKNSFEDVASWNIPNGNFITTLPSKQF